jgi:hypothetical protein
MFSDLFSKIMSNFLRINNFDLLKKGSGNYIYEYKNKEYRLSFCNHSRNAYGYSSFMDADLEIKNDKYYLALGLLHFVLGFKPFELQYNWWYYDNDVELENALNKQCEIISKYILPIANNEIKYDFNQLGEDNKRKVNDIVKLRYKGNWEEYQAIELDPIMEKVKRMRF